VKPRGRRFTVAQQCLPDLFDRNLAGHTIHPLFNHLKSIMLAVTTGPPHPKWCCCCLMLTPTTMMLIQTTVYLDPVIIACCRLAAA
jgi:hypothetical protein